MTTSVQRRRGSTADHLGFIGAPGELTVDTDIWSVRVHDGITAGGNLLLSATELDTKADIDHTHSLTDVIDGGDTLAWLLSQKADISHEHAISDVTDLQLALDSKADTSHGHALGDVAGLISALAGKAPLIHTHAIADVTGLQDALDLKLESADIAGLASTTYVDTAISNLVDAAPGALDTLNELSAALGDDPNFATTVTNTLAAKADIAHAHAIADVTGLQDALDDKADAAHTHAIADVTGLQSALDLKLEADDLNGLATETYVDSAIAGIPPSGGTVTPVANIIASSLGTSEMGTTSAGYFDEWEIESNAYSSSSDTSIMEFSTPANFWMPQAYVADPTSTVLPTGTFNAGTGEYDLTIDGQPLHNTAEVLFPSLSSQPSVYFYDSYTGTFTADTANNYSNPNTFVQVSSGTEFRDFIFRFNGTAWLANPPVKAVDTVNSTLTAPAGSTIEVDGVTISDGDLVMFTEGSYWSSKIYSYDQPTGKFVLFREYDDIGDVAYVVDGTYSGDVYQYIVSSVGTYWKLLEYRRRAVGPISLKIKERGVYRLTVRTMARVDDGIWPNGELQYGNNVSQDSLHERSLNYRYVPANSSFGTDPMTWSDSFVIQDNSGYIPSESSPLIVDVTPFINYVAPFVNNRNPVLIVDTTSTVLPVGTPGLPVSVLGVDVYVDSRVLFTNVSSATSHVYIYNQASGTFVEDTVADTLGDEVFVYSGEYSTKNFRFDGTTWMPPKQITWKIDIECVRQPLAKVGV